MSESAGARRRGGRDGIGYGVGATGWLFAAFLAVSLLQPANAATFNVDRTDDDPLATDCLDAVDDDCSLRGAIAASNGNADPADTINIPAGNYSLDDGLGDLEIDNGNVVTLNGAGAGFIGDNAVSSGIVIIIEPDVPEACEGETTATCILGFETEEGATTSGVGFGSSIFHISEGADVVIHGVVVSGGDAGNPGGGIFVEGAKLRLEESLVTGNYSSVGGGGVALVPASEFAIGGVTGGAGAETVSLTIVDSEISENFAGFFGGNQILSMGATSIENSLVHGNEFFGGFFGLESLAPPTRAANSGLIEDVFDFIGDFGLCGGVANFGDMTIANSQVSGNVGLFGGGICNTPLAAEFFELAATNAGIDFPPVSPPTDANLTVTDSCVGGNGALLGGGIWNRAGFVTLAALIDWFGGLPGDSLTFGSAHLTVNSEILDEEEPPFFEECFPAPFPSQVVANFGLFGGGVMNSRSVIGELELITAFGGEVAAATSGPFDPTEITVGTATADIDETLVLFNGSATGGGVLNDQLFIPFALLLFITGGPAETAGFLPFLPEPPDPADVTLTVSDSVLAANFALTGAGVANFGSTVGLSGSFLDENWTNSFFFGLAEGALSGPPLLPIFTMGGGLYNALGFATVDETTFYDNWSGAGGAIANVGGYGGLFEPLYTLIDAFLFFISGAEIPEPALDFADFDPGDTVLTVNASTLDDNDSFFVSQPVATTNGGFFDLADGAGAGIFNSGSFDETGTVADIFNSTLTANIADGNGGGLANLFEGQVRLTFATITENIAGYLDGSGGGIFEASQNDTITLKNTIVSGNIDMDGGNRPDCDNDGGTIESLGSNLIGDEGDCNVFDEPGDQVGTDADLEELADNGGPTETHRLLDGSAAINAVLGLYRPGLGGGDRGSARRWPADRRVVRHRRLRDGLRRRRRRCGRGLRHR